VTNVRGQLMVNPGLLLCTPVMEKEYKGGRFCRVESQLCDKRKRATNGQPEPCVPVRHRYRNHRHDRSHPCKSLRYAQKPAMWLLRLFRTSQVATQIDRTSRESDRGPAMGKSVRADNKAGTPFSSPPIGGHMSNTDRALSCQWGCRRPV